MSLNKYVKMFSMLPNFVSAQLRAFSAFLRVTIIYFAEVRGEDAELRGGDAL